jgi:hypothetical protein
VGQNSAAITSETTTRATADIALGQRIDSVVSSNGGNTAAIQAEATTRASADLALGQRVDVVKVAVDGNTAGLVSETTARATADTALGQRIDTVSSKTDKATADITTLQKTVADGDGALATRLDGLQTTVGKNTAAIATETTARTDADKALSQQQQTLSATVGEQSVKLQQFSEVAVDTKGKFNAMWGVKTDINDVRGGFGLVAEKDPDGITRVKFIADVDVFAMVSRTGSTVYPFVMKNGIIYMNKVLIDNAEIAAVIAKYIKVEHLSGVLIEGSIIRGGEIIAASIKSNGAPPAFMLDESGKLTAKNADISGVVNAHSGSFSGSVYGDSGWFRGTVYAGKIEGDVVSVTLGNTYSSGSDIVFFDKKLLEPMPFDRYFIYGPINVSLYKVAGAGSGGVSIIVYRDGAPIAQQGFDLTTTSTGVGRSITGTLFSPPVLISANTTPRMRVNFNSTGLNGTTYNTTGIAMVFNASGRWQ